MLFGLVAGKDCCCRLALLEVGIFRDSMGLERNAATTHFDAAGLKRLFSHGVRRFLSRARPRETCLLVVIKFMEAELILAFEFSCDAK